MSAPSTSPDIHLGLFEVRERVGEGAMGAVYRGVHRETGVEIALKVIRESADREALRAFHEEIQSHARLQHPGIVYLLEYGEVDAPAKEASDGAFEAGDPYVAMELADVGTVRDLLPLRTWDALRDLLVQVLDGLAYAHARRVIHRDLKPENLLVFESDDDSFRHRVKIADFGIAHAMHAERQADTTRLESAAGTPHYMTPEQFRGSWRTYGPWTDLYSLGCIAWELVCGHPPFRAENVARIGIKHHEEERPPLDPLFSVPGELEGWIHRAMAVDPKHRFRRAADAAWALPAAPSDEDPDRSPLAVRPNARSVANPPSAMRRYRRCKELFRELQMHQNIAISELNLAQVELMAGRFDAAERHLQNVEEQSDRPSGRAVERHFLRLARIVRSAGEGDWERFDELFESYADEWPDDARLIKDHPWLLEMAGDYAADAGDLERARRVWALVRTLWSRLGDGDAVDRLDEKLGPPASS